MTDLAMFATAPGADPEMPVIDLVRPFPGFPQHRRFGLVRLDGGLYQLRSLEDPPLQFLVAPPATFFPDYAPVLDEDVVSDLQISAGDDVVLLLVLDAGDSWSRTTANLLAPVVLNTATWRASQVILDDPDLPVAAPLLP